MVTGGIVALCNVKVIGVGVEVVLFIVIENGDVTVGSRGADCIDGGVGPDMITGGVSVVACGLV